MLGPSGLIRILWRKGERDCEVVHDQDHKHENDAARDGGRQSMELRGVVRMSIGEAKIVNPKRALCYIFDRRT